MRLSSSFVLSFFVILVSSSLFADKDKLWVDAAEHNWKPVRKWLKESPTAKEDLKWVHESAVAPVLDILLDMRTEIRENNPKLYELVFGQQGLAPWIGQVESTTIDAFFFAANVLPFFDSRLRDDNQKGARLEKINRAYRKMISNTFTFEELQKLAAIYQDRDLQILITRSSLIQETHIEGFELAIDRFNAVNPLAHVLEVILPDGILDVTNSNEFEHYMSLRLISEMLSDFSNDRIAALTQKLKSSVYRRELIKRQFFFPKVNGRLIDHRLISTQAFAYSHKKERAAPQKRSNYRVRRPVKGCDQTKSHSLGCQSRLSERRKLCRRRVILVISPASPFMLHAQMFQRPPKVCGERWHFSQAPRRPSCGYGKKHLPK